MPLSFGKTVTRAKRLIFANAEGKVSRHAQDGFQHIAVRHAHPCWPQTDRIGKCRSAAAVGDPQKATAAAEAPASRSTVLDPPDEDLENNGEQRSSSYNRLL